MGWPGEPGPRARWGRTGLRRERRVPVSGGARSPAMGSAVLPILMQRTRRRCPPGCSRPVPPSSAQATPGLGRRHAPRSTEAPAPRMQNAARQPQPCVHAGARHHADGTPGRAQQAVTRRAPGPPQGRSGVPARLMPLCLPGHLNPPTKDTALQPLCGHGLARGVLEGTRPETAGSANALRGPVLWLPCAGSWGTQRPAPRKAGPPHDCAHQLAWRQGSRRGVWARSAAGGPGVCIPAA